MRNGLIAVAILLLVGCGGKDKPLPSTPDPNVIRFEQIERKLFEVENQYMRGIDELERKITESAARESENSSDVDKRLMLQERKLETLAESIRKTEKELSKIRRNEPSQQASEEPRTERAVISMSPTQPQLSPIGVYDVSGQTVVTGSHLASREVETGETYRDEYGNRAKRTRTELVEVNEYGYQVRFSAQNMTERTVEIVVSAGAKEREITLPPQGIVKNASVDSAVGADLTVVADGLTKRYPVTYR